MSQEKHRIVYIATSEELTDPVYSARLWLAARNMPYSRRQWPVILCRDIYDFPGTILCPDGRKWPTPDIDDVMGDPRWFSYYFEETNGQPRRQVRLIERLKTLDLWFRIAKPQIQVHFSR